MPDTYSTRQGDTWDQVAHDRLGKEAYAHLLMEANPGHADMMIFPAGVELTLPDIPKEAEDRSNLPPWKR